MLLDQLKKKQRLILTFVQGRLREDALIVISELGFHSLKKHYTYSRKVSRITASRYGNLIRSSYDKVSL